MLYSTKALNFLALYEIATPPKHPFRDLLTLEGRRRRDRHIPRVSLLDYSDSSFKKLLDSGNDQALLNACGHDFGSFQSLLEIFQPVYDLYYLDVTSGFISLAAVTTTGKRKGRPRHLDAAGCLGLVLRLEERQGSSSSCSVIDGYFLKQYNRL